VSSLGLVGRGRGQAVQGVAVTCGVHLFWLPGHALTIHVPWSSARIHDQICTLSVAPTEGDDVLASRFVQPGNQRGASHVIHSKIDCLYLVFVFRACNPAPLKRESPADLEIWPSAQNVPRWPVWPTVTGQGLGFQRHSGDVVCSIPPQQSRDTIQIWI
jgi:hypothetical protein